MPNDLKPYPAYRDSGLPWLGQIPSHWEVRRNGRLFAQRNETGFAELPILEVSLKTGVRVRDMDAGRKQVMSDRDAYKRAAKGDIAYNMMRMWQGAVGVAPVDGLVSPAYVVARPLPSVDPHYYSYLFRTAAYMDEVDKFSRGIVKDRNRLYWDQLKQMPSISPPREEQSLIVRFLGSVDRKVNQFVRTKRRLIEVLTEQKQAIIAHAVTRGLNPAVPRKPSGIDWLGDVPEHWEVRKLRFLVDTLGGMTPSKSDATFWNGDVPWVSPKDMKRVEIHDSIDHITQEALAQTNIALVPPPAVLIVVRGMILARTFPVAVTRVPVTINQDMKALCPLNGAVSVNALYLRHLLSGSGDVVQTLIEESGHGTRVLRTDLWRNLPLPVPPRDEQLAICAFIADQTEVFDRTIGQASREIDLIREYRARLVADVVTGKTDVRDHIQRPDLDETEIPESLSSGEDEVDEESDERELELMEERIDS